MNNEQLAMSKLVVLKLGDGSFDNGFPVTLQIGDDGSRPFTEIIGKLPPAPEIPQHYNIWRLAYRRLGANYRLEAKPGQLTNVSKIEDCTLAANVLRLRLNLWLNSESFREIREKLLEQLMPSDKVRVIVQTEDLCLRRLPWHLWDLCDRYPKAEIALSAPAYERVEHQSPPKNGVKILAIIGNSAGINTQADRRLLEHIPNVQITFLVEPQPEELTEQLWKQGWDILFFAGHSCSQGDGETGRMYINQTDSLTIDQLKYALKKAAGSGLKIAIFNSCDGLGLARNLASLQIPQIIVMREPVPDVVAQEFLKSFIEAFARGESFYLAVREARERLQGLEAKFPCATWLPLICQNPAFVPPTWEELCGQNKSVKSNSQILINLRAAFLTSMVVTLSIMGIRYLGILQKLELKAYDQILRLQPQEKSDPRLLVVTVTEADIQAQDPAKRRGSSLSDVSLNKLLQKLSEYQPRAIGLDIYRDFPVDSTQKDLATRLEKNERLIAICKVSAPEVANFGIKPPPEIPQERLGFSDFIVDDDGVVRRHLLIMSPDPASPCTTPYALSVQLAFRYLDAEGISPKFTPKGNLQIGNVVFKPLEPHTGGYQQVDAWGHQVLLNYRSHRSPQDIAKQVTLTDVLKGQIDPNSVKDRIVLIGTTAQSFPDEWATPYSTGQWYEGKMPGVLVHAQMVSQILSAVLDKRSLLWVLPHWGEVLWIWGWSAIGGVLAWRIRLGLNLAIAIAIAIACLCGLCFALLVETTCWLPLVPPALALVATSASVAYTTSKTRQQQNTSKF
ncbi:MULTISPECIES: CHASE2 domain-containing protein [Cyanophyceae]|uniref:CHASE2 domain-containing protein n=1 Tax=Cyanophyceae TaxID=3028117 RepID=UPI001F54F26F|nr:CHASE2 domain-containing protein [Trichocoleus sp. FACHB-40]